ncbi:MAG: HAD-IA family hydrolase, partial [Actinomycetes bacterium]
GWNRLVNLTVVPSEAGEGRPSPAMLQFAANALGVTDPEQVVVVGDTESDMAAGVAFGAMRIVGVLSGAHTAELLLAGGASEVLNSVAELEHLLFT